MIRQEASSGQGRGSSAGTQPSADKGRGPQPPRVKEAKGEGDEGLLLVGGEGQRAGQGPSGGTQGAELLAASIEGHFYCTSHPIFLPSNMS